MSVKNVLCYFSSIKNKILLETTFGKMAKAVFLWVFCRKLILQCTYIENG